MDPAPAPGPAPPPTTLAAATDRRPLSTARSPPWEGPACPAQADPLRRAGQLAQGCGHAFGCPDVIPGNWLLLGTLGPQHVPHSTRETRGLRNCAPKLQSRRGPVRSSGKAALRVPSGDNGGVPPVSPGQGCPGRAQPQATQGQRGPSSRRPSPSCASNGMPTSSTPTSSTPGPRRDHQPCQDPGAGLGRPPGNPGERPFLPQGRAGSERGPGSRLRSATRHGDGGLRDTPEGHLQTWDRPGPLKEPPEDGRLSTRPGSRPGKTGRALSRTGTQGKGCGPHRGLRGARGSPRPGAGGRGSSRTWGSAPGPGRGPLPSRRPAPSTQAHGGDWG